MHCLFDSFVLFLNWVFDFLLLSLRVKVYIKDVSPLCFINVFSSLKLAFSLYELFYIILFFPLENKTSAGALDSVARRQVTGCGLKLIV